MSRHRYVRNLDLAEEMYSDPASSDDDEAGPEVYDGITAEQKVLMDSGLAHIRSLLGPDIGSDRYIRQALWDGYFEVEATTQWLLEQRDEAEKSQKAKERQKAKLVAAKKKVTSPPKPKEPVRSSAKPSTTPSPPSKGPALTRIIAQSQSITPSSSTSSTSTSISTAFDYSDMSASLEIAPEEPIEMSFSHLKLLEEVKRTLAEGTTKHHASMIVIGHVDAGKSTLMGRLLFELGQLAEKQRVSNERASDKMGKSSFSWAWGLDSLSEERERGVTMDITQTLLPLPNLDLTTLDAPGHRDFVPNLISGASQADTALLVIDATQGEFEAGFSGGGQSREHILLVRSLGVSTLIVAVNKMDNVDWSQSRFEEIRAALLPFLVQSGYHPSKISFVPCAAMKGINLTSGTAPKELQSWYKGPAVADLLNKIVSPARDIESPLRIPIANVFRGGTVGQPAGLGVSGRVITGVVQVGERVRVLPGDESATVRKIEIDENTVPWAAAGSNATLYLSGIERINIGVGSVLCPQSALVPLVSRFTAQIILFDLTLPITQGATVELFHQSRDTPATISRLIETIDRASGAVIKSKPRVLTKNSSARVEIQLRTSATFNGSTPKAPTLPLETFSSNKEMGRILLRRNGETIGAGIVLDLMA